VFFFTGKTFEKGQGKKKNRRGGPQKKLAGLFGFLSRHKNHRVGRLVGDRAVCWGFGFFAPGFGGKTRSNHIQTKINHRKGGGGGGGHNHGGGGNNKGGGGRGKRLPRCVVLKKKPTPKFRFFFL